MAPTNVPDASALLAYAQDEPGASVVQDALSREAAINLVNWVEVLTSVVRLGGNVPDFRQQLNVGGVLDQDSLLTITEITPADAETAAELYPRTKPAGLSLADRLCLATALRMQLPVLTSDRAWLRLDLAHADIRFIRPIS